MRKIYDRATGKLLAVMLAVLVAALCIGNAAAGALAREQRTAHQQMFAAFFGNVKALYPEVREEEWIALLNGTEHVEAGRELLRSYGVFEGGETLDVQEQFIRGMRVWVNCMLLLLFAGLGGCFFVFLRKRRERLEQLTHYLQEVAGGDYRLLPENQQEDELSGLQNELYKVVVLLREQAERLSEQKKALARSVSDISHQLKMPLTSVMVLVDNLAESRDMPEGTRAHFLEEITVQLSNMSWLVATMLKLSRLDAGVVELEREKISARELLTQVSESLEQQAEWREVALELDAPGDAEVLGDEKWLKEAFSNIVKNGIEHCAEQGKVTIALRDNAVYTEVSVHNFGEVLSGEEQKHIFERFYQRKSAAGGSASGVAGLENVGIGLALAKEIIERQNGFVSVESGEETGTVFTVKLLKNVSECH